MARRQKRDRHHKQGKFKRAPNNTRIGDLVEQDARRFYRKYLGKIGVSWIRKAVARLSKYNQLPNRELRRGVALPDSGADITCMGGNCWQTFDLPGKPIEIDLTGFDGQGGGCLLKGGYSVLLDPNGEAYARCRVGIGGVNTQADTLLSESQMERHGCEFHRFGGTLSISHTRWPMNVHCLPRGEGWFLPIRAPTPADNDLPELSFTGEHWKPENHIEWQVSKLSNWLGEENPLDEPPQFRNSSTKNTHSVRLASASKPICKRKSE